MVKVVGFFMVASFATVATADDATTASTSSSAEKKAACICTKEYRPVCSKDGKRQFGNACEARCAGVTDFTLGPCPGSGGGGGLPQTAADCKRGEVFKPFPCLVAPCKFGRCESSGGSGSQGCGAGMMKSRVFCKPGAMDCKQFICVRRPQCGGIAGLRCREGFRCVIGAKHPDASGYCYPTCRLNSRTTGCYEGEVCEDQKLAAPIGVCKEKAAPGVLKKLCGGPAKIKCAEGFYCLPKYRHVDSEGACVKSGGK